MRRRDVILQTGYTLKGVLFLMVSRSVVPTGTKRLASMVPHIPRCCASNPQTVPNTSTPGDVCITGHSVTIPKWWQQLHPVALIIGPSCSSPQPPPLIRRKTFTSSWQPSHHRHTLSLIRN
mmetsp:Transcript_137174/g.238557  ORF Transcript_137174/g.238557 Transcript_137174/m.238557 type:complete len:121 (+) Transcript_137174:2212-2574(+)